VLEDHAGQPLDVEFRSHGEIGEGRSLDRQNWWCEGDAGEITLFLRDADRVTHKLQQSAGGYWVGRRFGLSEVEVTLSPQGSANARPPAGPGLADELLRAAGFPHEGESDWRRLCATFELLSRVEPGILERLKVIASTIEGSPGDRLKTLADAIGAGPDVRPPLYNVSILRDHYRPVLDDGNV
jgi:hypothetical protein